MTVHRRTCPKVGPPGLARLVTARDGIWIGKFLLSGARVVKHRRQEELLLDRPAEHARARRAGELTLERAVGNRASAALLSGDFRRSQPASMMPASAVQLVMQGGAGNRAIDALLAPAPSARESTRPADGRGLELSDDTAIDARGTAAGPLVGGGGSHPLPIAVRNGPGHTPINTAASAGMAIDITLTSSSGIDADMASVQDSEQVSASINHTGSYAHLPPSHSSNSGYMPGYPIPPDQHSEPKARIIDCADNHGGNGSMDREQLDTFMAPAAGITTPTVIPNSGYLIRRIITIAGTQIKFRLHKSPKACTVNGFTTAAGPSPAQSDDVIVRP
jgi:hypothetical protein